MIENLLQSKDSNGIGNRMNETEYFRKIIQFAPDAFFHGDPKGNFIDCNEAAVDLTGYSSDELLKMNMADLFRSSVLNNKPLRYDILREGLSHRTERELTQKDGSVITIEMHSKMMEDGTYQSFIRDISESKKIENELKDSEERFKELARSTSTSIFVYKGNKVVYANKATEELTGYSNEELLSKKFWEFVPSNYQEATKERGIQRQRGEKVADRYELKILTKSGEQIWVDFTAGKISWNGEPAVIGSMVNINQYKEAQKQIKESEDRYKLITSISSDYLFESVIDDNNIPHTIWVGGSFEKITGYTLEECEEAGGWNAMLYPSDREIDQEAFKKLQQNKSVEIEIRILNKQKQLVWIRASAHPVWDYENNKLIGVVGADKDITDEKRGEIFKEIQYNISSAILNEKNLRNLLTSIREELGKIIKTKNFFFAFYDESTGNIYPDRDTDEMDTISEWNAEKSLTGYIIKEQKSLILEKWEIENLYNNGIIDLIGTLPEIWMGVPIFLKNKVYAVMVVQSYDSTEILNDYYLDLFKMVSSQLSLHLERKEVEDSRNRLLKAIVQSPVIIIITNSQGEIVYTNPKFSEVTGYEFEEVENKKVSFLKSGYHNKAFYKNLWETVLSGKDWHGEFKNRKKSGELYWEQSSISPMVDENGDIVSFVAVKEDVTEKKKMIDILITTKEQAVSSEKIKTEFLAQMSHEIRSPLNVILSSISLIKEEVDEEDSEILQFSFSSIDSSSKRIIRTIDLILNMTDIQAGAYQISVNSFCVKDMLKRLAGEYRSSAKIKNLEIRLDVQLMNNIISTDEFALSQIISNLLDNAVKYTKIGYIKISAEQQSADNLKISVSDTGIGISKEFLPKLFSAFTQEEQGYTRSYDGNGLGLALVKNYCNLLNAEISVESIKGKGSTFEVIIPQI